MRLCMFTDGRFYWDGNRRFFTLSNWRRVLVSEYARFFERVCIFCRCSLRDLDTVPQKEIIDIPNVSFVRLPQFRGRRGYIWYRRRILDQIRAELKKGDVCFVRIPSQVGSAGIEVARSIGIPIVCQIVGDAEMVFRTDETLVPTRLLRWLVSFFAFRHQHKMVNLCQKCTAISVQLAQKYCESLEQVAIVPNSVVVQESFLPFRGRKKDEVFNALFVGRIEHHKNIQLFLYTLAELRKQGCNIKTTIVGSGRYQGHLARLAEELGISEWISFTGHIGSREELLEYYRQGHMLYLLSFTEGLGMVLMEAGAASLPIIASCVGGIPEIALEGENAFLVQPDDVQGCVQATAQLFNDEGCREKMGRRSQQIMRAYTVERIVSSASEVIKKVAEVNHH